MTFWVYYVNILWDDGLIISVSGGPAFLEKWFEI